MWTVIVRDPQGQVVVQHEWAQGSLTVGRDQGSSIVLPSKLASRKHARLDLLNGVPVVVDQGSSNGTIVNGARITVPTRLDDASRIQIGEFQLTVQKVEQEDEGEKTVLMRPGSMPPAAPPRPAAPPPPRPQAAPPPRPVAPPGQTVLGAPPPRPQPPPAVAAPAAPPAAKMPEPRMPEPAFPAPAFPSGPAASGPVDDQSVTSQFERHLKSVRSYREESQSSTLTRGQRLEAEWLKLVSQMRALQTRLGADKRVQAFAISRDQKEITIKITDPHEKRGYRYFMLSRDHPEGKFPGVLAVWLREFGRDDAQFEEPQKAVEELMLRLAGTLA